MSLSRSSSLGKASVAFDIDRAVDVENAIWIHIVSEAALDLRKKQTGGPYTRFKAARQFLERSAPSPDRRQWLCTLPHSGYNNGGQWITECTCNKLGDCATVNERHVAREDDRQVIRCPLQRSNDPSEGTFIGVQIFEMDNARRLIGSSLAAH